MIRPLFVTLLVATIGCSPDPKPQSEPLSPNPGSLVRSYRDAPRSANGAWTGQRVRIQLDPGTYTIGPGAIYFHSGTTDVPPCMVFECVNPPANSSAVCEIVGRCEGMVRDGIRRGPGIDFYLRVTGCTAGR